MPRSAKTQSTSAFGQFRKRTRELLVNLRSEISSKQAVLRRLKGRRIEIVCFDRPARDLRSQAGCPWRIRWHGSH